MPETARAFAPGRINLIGEHTDYNGGLALPFAIEAGVTVQARRLSQPVIEVRARDLDEEDSFELGMVGPASGWRAFVRGAVAELQGTGAPLCGAQLEIRGTVPRGAGLASSAALTVALALALIALNDLDRHDVRELARLCSRVENVWAGAQTGLLDQLAALCAVRDSALRIDFRSLELLRVPLELDGHSLVTLDSGERHAHADSGYNERRAECTRACSALGLTSLRRADADAAARLPPPLDRRVRHVLSENARVEAAVTALASRDLAALGRLLDQSHASLRDDFDVSTSAIEATVERARHAGARGARLIGGGFGGHVLALMPPDAPLPAGARSVTPAAGARIVT